MARADVKHRSLDEALAPRPVRGDALPGPGRLQQGDPARNTDLRAFADAWRRMPKWVVSRSPKSVGPGVTLVDGDFEAVMRPLKADFGGVIDELQLIVHPVVLGSGNPFFAGARPPLRFVASDRVGEVAIKLRYVPA